jgi:hypothetical protein
MTVFLAKIYGTRSHKRRARESLQADLTDLWKKMNYSIESPAGVHAMCQVRGSSSCP